MSAVKVQGADALSRSTAWGKSATAATGRVKLFSVRAYNSGATSFWLQIYDATSAPANQDALIGTYECYNGSFVGDEWGTGLPLTNGVFVMATTTQTGTTLIAADEARFVVGYTAR